MNRFKELFTEKWIDPYTTDTIFFVFGRFNPPHLGHGFLFREMEKLAQGEGIFRIYVSHTQDQNKNPLSHDEKIFFLKEMFPQYKNNIITDPRGKYRGFPRIISDLHEMGYKKITVVSDLERKKSLEGYFQKINDNPSFKSSLNIVSVGGVGRQDGITLSATMIRDAVRNGARDWFIRHVPKFKYSKQLYTLLRRRLMK